jgi:hypothetical protein
MNNIASRWNIPMGNGRWFYFWYRASPGLILQKLCEYSHKSMEEILEIEKSGVTALHDLAEQVGLIYNKNDFDRSPVNDSVCHASVHVVEYLLRGI